MKIIRYLVCLQYSLFLLETLSERFTTTFPAVRLLALDYQPADAVVQFYELFVDRPERLQLRLADLRFDLLDELREVRSLDSTLHGVSVFVGGKCSNWLSEMLWWTPKNQPSNRIARKVPSLQTKLTRWQDHLQMMGQGDAG